MGWGGMQSKASSFWNLAQRLAFLEWGCRITTQVINFPLI
jgi:hypothetical protein